MLRAGRWTRPACVSPVRVNAGEPGSRPRSATARRRGASKASLEGASVRAVVPPGASPAASSSHNVGAERLVSRRRRCATYWRPGHALGRVLSWYGDRHARTAWFGIGDPSAQPRQQGPADLSPWENLPVPGVDQREVETSLLQHVPDALPVLAGGLHHHPGHALRAQPVGQPLKTRSERRIGADLLATPAPAGDRTQATNSSLATSRPAHRSNILSTGTPR